MNSDQLGSELRAIASRLDAIERILASKSRWVSGAKAARIIGVSYQTFKRRYVDEGRILPNGSRFDINRVKELK